MKPRGLLAPGALFASALFARCGTVACSSEGTGAPLDGGASDVVGVFDAHADAKDITYGGVPDGWVPYTDYDRACGLYVPKDRSHLPAPIAWQACPATPETQGYACREMILDGSGGSNPPGIVGDPQAVVTSSGVLLQVGRLADEGIYDVVADADGIVHNAILVATASPCRLGTASLTTGKFLYPIYDRNEGTDTGLDLSGGAIGGDIDAQHIRVLFHMPDQIPRIFVAGPQGIAEVAAASFLTLHSWIDSSLLQTIVSPAENESPTDVFFQDKALFWASGIDTSLEERVYAEDGGVRELITSGGDPTRGVADFGTDGVDMAWVEGTRPGTSGIFTQVFVIASNYTTDPTMLQHHVIRSDLTAYPFGGAPFVVGCGYGARVATFATEGGYRQGTLVVRLQDGHGWLLSDDPGIQLGFRRPLAMTCDEIFLLVQERDSGRQGAHFNIARVRLDSLGPGMTN